MNESIYNLVPRDYIVPKKEAMHRSVHNPQALLTGSTFGCTGTTRLLGAGAMTKKEGALFGPPKNKSDTLSQMKSSMAANNESSGPFLYGDRRKDTVPLKDDKPVMGIKTSKNFIVANAVEAILQVPKKVESGELNYTMKEDYGKIPAYLTQVKEEIRRENEMIDKYVKEQMGDIERTPEQFEEMSEAERLDLLDALKAKWDAVNAKYQKITHLVRLDTTGQLRRKESLESELQQLENDIEKLHKAGPIMIRK